MMRYKEDYLSYEDCLKLKSLGYNEASDGLWYMCPTYNGHKLGSDEEYELRVEGITNFNYVPEICWMYHKNEYDEETIHWTLLYARSLMYTKHFYY